MHAAEVGVACCASASTSFILRLMVAKQTVLFVMLLLLQGRCTDACLCGDAFGAYFASARKDCPSGGHGSFHKAQPFIAPCVSCGASCCAPDSDPAPGQQPSVQRSAEDDDDEHRDLRQSRSLACKPRRSLTVSSLLIAAPDALLIVQVGLKVWNLGRLQRFGLQRFSLPEITAHACVLGILAAPFVVLRPASVQPLAAAVAAVRAWLPEWLAAGAKQPAPAIAQVRCDGGASV